MSLPTFDAEAIVQVAMDEEAAPFFDLTDSAGEAFTFGLAQFYPRLYTSGERELKILLVRSKIGLVNAAAAITAALQVAPAPAVVVSAGTAGGLRADVNVSDIALGTDYTYTDADATAFGYARGQVPGMPERFSTPAFLQDVAAAVAADYTEGAAHRGTMLAGGSFVTAHNVADTREVFPQAVSTDMETTAIAQVCESVGIPFIAARGISDLCGPAADQDFHLGVDIVGPRSARVAMRIIEEVTQK